MSELLYKTTLWDFHGTFTNNKGRAAHSINTAYIEVTGRPVSRGDFQALMARPEGIPASRFLNEHINGSLSEEDRTRLVEIFREQNQIVYIPKHIYLLKKLHELGVVNAIVTNGEEAVVRKTLEQWGVLPYITEVYGRGKGSKLEKTRKKPSPDVLDFVVRNLQQEGHHVRQETTLMVGDYTDDIGAGSSAGIDTAFIVTGPNQRPEYYPTQPTFTLLDTPSLAADAGWALRGNVYNVRDLPKIVSGQV